MTGERSKTRPADAAIVRPEPARGPLGKVFRYLSPKTSVAGVTPAEAHGADALVRRGKLASGLGFFRRWPVLSGVILTAIVLMAILAPLITTSDPEKANLRHRTYPPIWQDGGRDQELSERGKPEGNYLLGTDQLGRDIWSRLAFGARISLVVAAVSLISGTLIGTALGLIAGWYGGLVDELITRFVDVWLGLPFILIALVIAIVLGTSFLTIIILLALLAWTPFVRQVRAEVLSLKNREYVFSAQIAGASTTRILIRHLLPGVANTVIVIATFRIGQLILVEAFLSFLGAGIPPPTPAWGAMISDGRGYLRDAWWISVFPGLAIFLTVASMSFFGDWLRDFLDPRLRQVE